MDTSSALTTHNITSNDKEQVKQDRKWRQIKLQTEKEAVPYLVIPGHRPLSPLEGCAVHPPLRLHTALLSGPPADPVNNTRGFRWDTQEAAPGLPGGSVVKNLPANTGDTGSIPDPGRCHMPRGNDVCVPQPLGLCSGARCNWRVAPLTATGEKACFPQQRLSTTEKKKKQQQPWDSAGLRNLHTQTPGHGGGVGDGPRRPALPRHPQGSPSGACPGTHQPPLPHLRLLCTLPHSHTPTSVGIDGHRRARGFYGKVSITPSLFLYPVPPGDG